MINLVALCIRIARPRAYLFTMARAQTTSRIIQDRRRTFIYSCVSWILLSIVRLTPPSAACHRRCSTILWTRIPMPTISLPTRSAITLLHAQSIVICPRNLLSRPSCSRSRPHRRSHHCISLCPACHTHHRLPESHSKHRLHTLSRIPRAASSTHVAKSHPRRLIRQLLVGECTKRLEGLTLAYTGHDSPG